MSLAEVIPHRTYGYPAKTVAAPSSNVSSNAVTTSNFRYVRAVSIEATKEIDSVSFSTAVHFRFYAGIVMLLASGVISLAGVISEVDWVSIVGASTLAVSALLFSSWLNRAHCERRNTKD